MIRTNLLISLQIARINVAATGGWLIPLEEIGPIPSVPHTVGPRKIIWIILAEKYMREHPVRPLPSEECFNFLPSSFGIKDRKAPSSKSTVPVPLIRVKAGRRNCITTFIISFQNFLGFLVKKDLFFSHYPFTPLQLSLWS